mgnify:CR=1 FL=1|jgi:hypothetical protein
MNVDVMPKERQALVPDASGLHAAVVRRFNPKMADGVSRQKLDQGWKQANGLRGLEYKASEARPARELAPRVDHAHVVATLGCGFDDAFVERALKALDGRRGGMLAHIRR